MDKVYKKGTSGSPQTDRMVDDIHLVLNTIIERLNRAENKQVPSDPEGTVTVTNQGADDYIVSVKTKDGWVNSLSGVFTFQDKQLKRTLVEGVTGPAGPTGSTGATGAPGLNGTNGADGTIVRMVSKSVTANSTYNETFDASSNLITLPVSYSTIDGMISVEHPIITNLTTSGFTVVPTQDGVLIYSYLHI